MNVSAHIACHLVFEYETPCVIVFHVFVLIRSDHGLYFFNATTANYKSDLSSLSFARKLPFSSKSGSGILRASLISGKDDVWSCFNNQSAKKDSFVNHGAKQPDEIAVGAPAAVKTPNRSGFLSGVDEFDLDQAVEGFSSIPEAIEDIRQGKVCLLLRCGFFSFFSLLSSAFEV